jgi:MoaA/NifB/PqqE/SkfB family radical SAM enzyme
MEWVHFSGGEPTLWRDGERGLADLLIDISRMGFEPGLTTNGSSFIDYSQCSNFFKKYLDNAIKMLRLYVSIDTFHGNFDLEKGRAKSLDNVVRCKREMVPEKEDLLNVVVLATVSKDEKSLLPDEMIEHYESQGVEFNFVPLGLKGRAKSMGHLCPDLESGSPEDLGAYQSFHEKEKGHMAKSNLVLIGNDYYIYDNDGGVEFNKRWHKIAGLGHLAEKIMGSEQVGDEYSRLSKEV